MWELLQKLEKLGWKPYGKSITELTETEKNVRLLTSLSSGLWQFCKENKMLIGFSPRTRTKNAHESYGSILGDIEYWGSDYEYRLIESALTDEDNLEEFLLNNIKIDDR